MAVLTAGIFTYTLTNDNITLSASELGVRKISVYNNSAVAGTVLGGQKLGSLSSTAISLAQNEGWSVEGVEASTIKDLTITAPAGCTLLVTALI